MKNVLLSTAAWPNLHYLYYVANCESVVIEQHETYPRQTFRNRYEILSANGILPLTIPVKRSGNHTKTKDVLIDYSTDWQSRHWTALTSAYRKSPFFEFFEHDLRPFFETPVELLIEYNMAQLRTIIKLLRLRPSIALSPAFEKTPSGTDDKRWITDPRNHFTKDKAVSELLGKGYYQTFGDKFPFAPNLSCLDILFNTGLKTGEYLVSG